MNKYAGWVSEQKEEQQVDTKIRQMMLKANITYQEAKSLVMKGQKGLADF